MREPDQPSTAKPLEDGFAYPHNAFHENEVVCDDFRMPPEANSHVDDKKFLKRSAFLILAFAACAVVALATFALGLRAWGSWYDNWTGYSASMQISDGVCNIAIVPLTGNIIAYAGAEDNFYGGAEYAPISTNPDDFRSHLRAAEADPSILGILVRIDSGGGSPVASEIIAQAITDTVLPTAALIREYGTSGAYFAASAADTIFASPLSDVGSIGITMSYVENSRQNEQDGLGYVSLTSGTFKDAGNPNKPLSAAEREIFERDLDILHTEFVRHVAENRNMSVDSIAALADGSSMPGALALEKGLVDQLGDQNSTKDWFAAQLGITPEEIYFCE